MQLLPRIAIAGLSGGSGKTIVSLGLCRALVQNGLAVRPFKKGPDYIDAKWLSLAAGAEACNLDAFLMPPGVLPAVFAERMQGHAIGVIEGNRGIFDGGDMYGSLSTAELCRLLSTPLILVIDATKMTRTVAAIVAGVNAFDPHMRLAGVVLNRTAGDRHRGILRQAIEHYTDVPIVGILPKLGQNPIPERHMGLMSDQELVGDAEGALDELGRQAAGWLDIPAIRRIASGVEPLVADQSAPLWPASPAITTRPRIGVARDAAFWFYYPENIEALRRAGADIAWVSLLAADPWPKLDGLYLGGGFPETHAAALSANNSVRERVLSMAKAGMPIYAECGGLMYLARSLDIGDAGGSFPMAGVFPVDTRLCARPQGLGYAEAEVVAESPFHPLGTRLRGHEFHYSCCVCHEPADLAYTLRLTRGVGMTGNSDGLQFNNCFASYLHIHALGTPHWAPRFVSAAARHAAQKG